jgi:hypothetical protein
VCGNALTGLIEKSGGKLRERERRKRDRQTETETNMKSEKDTEKKMER